MVEEVERRCLRDDRKSQAGRRRVCLSSARAAALALRCQVSDVPENPPVQAGGRWAWWWFGGSSAGLSPPTQPQPPLQIARSLSHRSNAATNESATSRERPACSHEFQRETAHPSLKPPSDHPFALCLDDAGERVTSLEPHPPLHASRQHTCMAGGHAHANARRTTAKPTAKRRNSNKVRYLPPN